VSVGLTIGVCMALIGGKRTLLLRAASLGLLSSQSRSGLVLL